MTMPETDLKRIDRWCRERVPEALWDEVKIIYQTGPGYITIFETRPDWQGGPDWIDFPIARLRYSSATGQWVIYWRDRNLKFHLYDRKRPTKNIQDLLDYIGSHQDPIFFG